MKCCSNYVFIYNNYLSIIYILDNSVHIKSLPSLFLNVCLILQASRGGQICLSHPLCFW